jgi:hypothetical protein
MQRRSVLPLPIYSSEILATTPICEEEFLTSPVKSFPIELIIGQPSNELQKLSSVQTIEFVQFSSSTCYEESIQLQLSYQFAAILSAVVTKRASYTAFFDRKKGRSMGSPDVLDAIGAVASMFESP